MKTALVTGGAGFIGSHLCEFLLANGYVVICLDNFFTGSKDNVEHLANNEDFVLIEHDILEPFRTDRKIDEIYNLACPASPVHYQRDPIGTVKVNTIGMLNILDLSREKGARLLQASTSEVYGDPEVHPQTEDYKGNVDSTGPRACYDEGKRVAETLCYDYQREHDVDVRVARIFNTYGPRMAMDDGRVISNFVVQALNGEDITVYGDGSQTRSFCYVSDMVLGLHKLMMSSYIKPVNLGNPDERTIKDAANIIREMTGSASQIVMRPLPTDDPRQRRPDISRAEKQLGWQPEVSFEKGLGETINYFKDLLGRD